MSSIEKCNLMTAMFDAAVAAAQPDRFIPDALARLLPDQLDGRFFVTGFGKASAGMARTVEDHLPPAMQLRCSGEVIVPDGHEDYCTEITITTASHPVPDVRGLAAAGRIMDQARSLTSTDLMLVLVSGGGSSLFCLPHTGITLKQKQKITSELLAAGASIDQINCVRKHLSAVKGGHLAVAAYPARTLALSISDVPGDDVTVIASGPTVADPTSAAQARTLLANYDIELPTAVDSLLNSPACETPFPECPALSRSEMHLVATPKKSLYAAAAVAEKAGYQPVLLGDALEGSSRDLAEWMAEQAGNAGPGKALISGGETTVKVSGSGYGGRNAEFIHALCLVLADKDIAGESRFYALAADTDGIDGRPLPSGPVAGAMATPDSLARAAAMGMDAAAMLADNDSHSFFTALGDALVTGPTRTNVNDFRVVLT
jgi:hydroxypyruvate reductase